jgi:DNA-directed RNA polymerase subunit K/omega
MTKKETVSVEKNGKAEEVVGPIKLNTTDSIYRGIILACLRSKQLIKGATPRTSAEFSHKRKNTRIAVEEVKQGLVIYEEIPEELI